MGRRGPVRLAGSLDPVGNGRQLRAQPLRREQREEVERARFGKIFAGPSTSFQSRATVQVSRQHRYQATR
ncbi:hypothetical protein [Aromatoleum aromaticum]|uniref:hypothetical protein n=1 Tax=Aromatoleum aromaticum TaxID=551760 RepID=UPI00059F4F2C|nr:hypothetical protein [Aromatoleum aromaticum]